MFAIQQYCSFISDFWSIRFKSFTEPHPKMLEDLVLTKLTVFHLWNQLLKVRDFQKKIGIIYRLKQICHFIILNSSFEFSRVICNIEQNVISKIQFKVVI